MPSDQPRDRNREANGPDPAKTTLLLRDRFAREMAECEARSARLSLTRLVAFLGAGALFTAAATSGASIAWLGAALLTLGFVIAVLAQRRVVSALDAASVRRDIQERHLWRIGDRWNELKSTGAELLPSSHAYAWDVDVVGTGSLFQRIDVTHTWLGERTLAAWLGAPATPDQISARQTAVAELKLAVELRQELEASALRAANPAQKPGVTEKLDGRPFLKFAELPSYFAAHPLLRPAILALPLLTLLCYLLGLAQLIPSAIWLLPLSAQVVLLLRSAEPVRQAFDLAASRQGAVEAFEHMLRVVEAANFQSPLLCALQQRLIVDGTKPSALMRSLRSWTSAAELRQQFLFYILVGPLTLWDLHVLYGLDRWNQRVGKRTADFFAALAELEALSSLATLSFVDPETCTPEIVAVGGALSAEQLAHPLLTVSSRIANDVELGGPGAALLVTGSNMAGKSTLLRALGLNVALALAGGPVCAKAMRVPPVRLRASMRAEDSLQSGASYFHAELSKLKTVVQDAEAAPPLLFLLDELLRGTNARARHLGAKAVLLHLLKRGAMGLVATHDVALAALEQAHKGRIANVHFTDVVENGEMRFDYTLRPGVVRTSNALRLLALAGIDVHDADVGSVEALEIGALGAHRPEGRL